MARNNARIDALDALRGFAILGILLINIQLFSGYGFIGTEGRDALAWGGRDEALKTFLDIFVRAKFYSLFSLLFGYSFVMFARKVAENAVRLHLRRMIGLLVIGLAHSLLLWPWDILLLYALVGMLLAPFLHRSPATLLTWSLCLFVAVGVLNEFGSALGIPVGRNEWARSVLQDNVPVLAGGSYPEVLRANLYLTGSLFVEWLQGLRPLRVLGMFLLGATAAALRLAEKDHGKRFLLPAVAAIGLLIGLALTLIDNYLQPESAAQRLVHIVADTAAAHLLATGYAAALVLWWHGSGLVGAAVRGALAPVGRMALTNYLLHSAICVPLFYGFGTGWFAEVSLARLLLFAAALFGAQIVFSTLWLSVFLQGPMEWLWRWQIKGHRPPFLK